MSSHKKGDRLERGIWELKDGNGYIGELLYVDPKTGKRVREQKTSHLLTLVQKWRLTTKADALRNEITRKKDQVVISFENFADEYFAAWRMKTKVSTAHGEKKRLEGILKPYFGDQPIHTITRKDYRVLFKKATGRPDCRRG